MEQILNIENLLDKRCYVDIEDGSKFKITLFFNNGAEYSLPHNSINWQKGHFLGGSTLREFIEKNGDLKKLGVRKVLFTGEVEAYFYP